MYEESNRTICISNLDESVTAELLTTLCSQMGEVTSCKISRDAMGDLMALVEFSSNLSASLALSLNQCTFLGKEIKVTWDRSQNIQKPTRDLSEHFHIYVGDLSPEVDVNLLRDAFAPFGEISHTAISRDPETLKTKGYGFVVFVKKHEAENAITAMNGQWLGNRPIKTNWSTRKVPTIKKVEKPTFDEIYGQASPSNTTVYIGGIGSGLDEDLMLETFGSFGTIQDVKCHPDRGYAFVKFITKGCAARAILELNGTKVNGYMVRCSWGKELIEKLSIDKTNNMVSMTSQESSMLSWPVRQEVPMYANEPYTYGKDCYSYGTMSGGDSGTTYPGNYGTLSGELTTWTNVNWQTQQGTWNPHGTW